MGLGLGPDLNDSLARLYRRLGKVQVGGSIPPCGSKVWLESFRRSGRDPFVVGSDDEKPRSVAAGWSRTLGQPSVPD